MRARVFRHFAGHQAAFILAALLVALALFFVSPPFASGADPGQTTFEQKCKGCHTIGGGRAVGPDLKGVTEKRDGTWLVRTIVEPDQLIAQGDPLAKQLAQEYGMAMPKVGVSQQEAETILAYLAAQSEGTTSTTSTRSTASSSTALRVSETAGNALNGKDLFIGEVRFQNGAAACVACHHIEGIGGLGGGNVAKDLTGRYAALGAEASRSILQTAPFPVMREAFAGHPLTENETDDLLAFLREGEGTPEGSNNDVIKFVSTGIAGLAFLFVAFEVTWRGRLRGVRQRIVKGGWK